MQDLGGHAIEKIHIYSYNIIQMALVRTFVPRYDDFSVWQCRFGVKFKRMRSHEEDHVVGSML